MEPSTVVTTAGPRRASLVALLAAACIACAGPNGESPPPTAVRDSAGVRIVENRRPSWTEGRGWVVGEALLVLGGEPEGDLFGVSGAVRLDDGGVAVAMEGAAQVRFYDVDGALRAVYGGSGDGPGEFRMLAALGRGSGDTVWAYDYGAARLSLITAAEGVVASVTLTPPLSAGMVVGRRSDGSVVVAQMWGSPDPSAPAVEGLVREPAAYVVHDADGRRADTIGFFAGREVLHRLEGGRMTMSVAPFARTASHTLVGDDLVVGSQMRHELSVRTATGATTSLRWAGGRLELRAGDVADWKEAVISAAAAADRASVRSHLADTPVPATRPAYGRTLSDPTGALWVAEYALPGEEPSRWDVLDATGRWLGPVRMPPAFRPLDIGTRYVLGVSRDALDVERVELRRLIRPAP